MPPLTLRAHDGGRCALRGDGTYRQDITLLAVATSSARDALALLLSSLTLQMDGAGARAADAHIARFPGELFRRKADRTRWRNGYLKSFLVGYCEAVAERVAAVRGEAAPAGGGCCSPGALVLAGDEQRVREEFAARFPVLGRARSQRIRTDGFAAGRAAGRFADIGGAAIRGGLSALPTRPAP